MVGGSGVVLLPVLPPLVIASGVSPEASSLIGLEHSVVAFWAVFMASLIMAFAMLSFALLRSTACSSTGAYTSTNLEASAPLISMWHCVGYRFMTTVQGPDRVSACLGLTTAPQLRILMISLVLLPWVSTSGR